MLRFDNSGDFIFSYADYLVVKHCTITNGAGDSSGVANQGSHAKILFNIISQTRVGVYCHDVTLGVEGNALIEGNTIFNCGSYVKEVDGAIIAYEMYDVTIVNNEIDLTMVSNVQINGIRVRSSNKVIIANNRVRGGANCISVNPFNGSANYVNIINNKVSQPTTYGIIVKGKSNHVNVSNNVIENTPNAGLCIATDTTTVPNGLTITTTSGSATATLSSATTAIAPGDVLTITGYTGNVVVASISGTTVTLHVTTGSNNKFIDNRILGGSTSFNADSGVRTLP